MTCCQMSNSAVLYAFHHVTMKRVFKMIGDIGRKLRMKKKLLLFLDNTKCNVDVQITTLTLCLQLQIVANDKDSGSPSNVPGCVSKRNITQLSVPYILSSTRSFYVNKPYNNNPIPILIHENL